MIFDGLTSGQIGLIIGICCGVVVLAILGVVLYFCVIRKNRYRKIIKELDKKYSFLDALLVGQDSQYIHRLEIISRTNLLYVEKYETFSKRFQEIYENDDKFTHDLIKQLLTLINNNQYKDIKNSINDAKRAVLVLEERINKLDADLFEVIKVEEDSRTTILKLKESYRQVKQEYYSSAADLEFVSETFNKVFDKLDSEFSKFEELIESAEYDEANALVPTISKVIGALETAISNLPDLVSLVHSVLPNRVHDLETRFREVEKDGLPLFHFAFKNKIEGYKKVLKEQENKLTQLQYHGVKEACDIIQSDIDATYSALDEEIESKAYFEKESQSVYNKAAELEKAFLKICAILPEVNKVYLIDEHQSGQLELLRKNIDKLGEAKRNLDGFVHSGTKQPFSLLKKKLDDLNHNYENASVGLAEFKTYLESLKISAQEAYNMVFNYYYRAKQIELQIREFGIPSLVENYSQAIDEVYEHINEIDKLIKKKPINIVEVNQKVESLKGIANTLFDEVESKSREQKLAESAIVYANRDRNHQQDVHQQLSMLEKCFNDGDFLKVYHDANAIYRKNHVEESNDK